MTYPKGEDAVDVMESFCELARENIMVELEKKELYTLLQYMDELQASSLLKSSITLSFDEINDLLCAQTADLLRFVMRLNTATPELRNLLALRLDAMNEKRLACGRRKV